MALGAQVIGEHMGRHGRELRSPAGVYCSSDGIRSSQVLLVTSQRLPTSPGQSRRSIGTSIPSMRSQLSSRVAYELPEPGLEAETKRGGD
jgi:hypothetical protein